MIDLYELGLNDWYELGLIGWLYELSGYWLLIWYHITWIEKKIQYPSISGGQNILCI